jgi:hypothetical protein
MSDTLTRNFESAALSPLNHPNDAADLSPASDPLAPQPSGAGETLTRSMQVALVKMMYRSDQAKEVIAQLERFGKAECSGVDYFKLGRLGLAEQRNCSYHRLTVKGRRAAKDALRDLARADGIHALDYELEPRSGAPFVCCTCGWRVYKSSYYASYRSILYRFGDHHLRHVRAKL